MENILLDLKIDEIKKSLEQERSVPIRVLGYSMWPFLKNGETVLIRPIAFGEIGIGDIILTYREDRAICHRVFRKKGLFLQTKADGLVGLDHPVCEREILGKVFAKIVGEKVVACDGRWRRMNGAMIAWITYVSAPFYPALRKIKKFFRPKPRTSIDQAIMALVRFGITQDWPDKQEHLELSENQCQAVLSQICAEGISGWIYAHCKDTGIIPPQILKHLESEYLLNTGRNLLLRGQREEIARSFEEARIPLLFVRGGVLIGDIYSDPGTRPMIDLDMVIRQRDFVHAKRILEQVGYASYQGKLFFVRDDDLFLDLHLDRVSMWRTASCRSLIDLGSDPFWSRCLPLDEFNFVRKPDGIDSILTCCDHLQGHSFKRLIWFIDIAQLIRSQEDLLAWGQLVVRAQKFDLSKTVYFVFRFLDQHGLAKIPAHVLQSLKENASTLNFIERRTLAFLVANERQNLSGELLSFFAIPSWKQRIKTFWTTICIEKKSFPLAQEKISAGNYLMRTCKIFFYVFAKLLVVFRPIRSN